VAFCTTCGQPRNAAGPYCTSCGAPFTGPAVSGGPAGGPPAGPVTSPVGGLADDPAGAPEDDLDEAFGGLFAPRRADTGNRGDTARLPSATAAGGGAGSGGTGGGWPGPGWEGAPGPGWQDGPGGDWQEGPGRDWQEGPGRDWQDGPGHAWRNRLPVPSGGRSRVITAIAGAAVVVAAAGGVLGFEAYEHHAQPTGSAAHRPAGASASTSGGAAPKAMVAVAPGVRSNPATGAIVRMLTTYFTAINSHDFSGYQAVLNPKMQRSVTASQFATGYRTTSDSGATLTRVSAAGGRTEAVVTFTSHQDPSEGPGHSPCTSWVITLFLQPSSGGFLIGPAPRGYHAAHRSC
jgi:hypothetical protein